jgi:type 1 glutamine amidotransferase
MQTIAQPEPMRIGDKRRVVVPTALLLGVLAGPAPGQVPAVLLLTEANGFVHPSIADGVTAVSELAAEAGFALEVTDDSEGFFTAPALALYDTVVWLSTTGDVLDAAEQSAFEAYVAAGGGWVGIHAAADCEYQWPWYGELLGNGAWFDSHPAVQEAQLELDGPGEPGAGSFPASRPMIEEWYNFQENPRPVASVVLTVDESTYDPGPGAMGADHPIAWHHESVGGRAFYTALGHRPETFADPDFRSQLRAAILWTAGALLFEDGFEAGTTDGWDQAVE